MTTIPTIPSQRTDEERQQLVFTSSQAAAYLGVSLATIRRWTDAGHVACYRTPGGQRRFSKAQLDGFIVSLEPGKTESAHHSAAHHASRAA
jgi:excisionase family DNA binding protein